MKKIFTFLSSFLVLVSIGNKTEAQNLVTQGATGHVSGPADALMTAHVTILNNGSTPQYVFVARISQTLAPGHVSYFCWNQCYDPVIDVSPDSTLILPGESTSIFNGDLNPLGYEGSSTVSYAYFDRNGDTAFASFTYDALPTGINELSAKGSIRTPFPNPANAYTKIFYSVNSGKDARIIICNMLGSTIKEIKLNDNQNTLTVSTGDLQQGIYFYSLVVDGKSVSSKKLIVSHN
jgi:hypothetical protein